MRDTLWITGAGGLIGNYLVKEATRAMPSWNVVGLIRASLDLMDFSAVREAFRRESPKCVIHCAALSKSPECQANPAFARKVNVETTALLADLTANIPFFFFSTDLVFDGRAGNYDESARVNPLGVYAETKAEAERAVLSNPAHTVIRTSLNGGTSPTADRGFNEQIRASWRAGKVLRLFTDEYRSPICAAVTARATCELVAGGRRGLFHIAGSERLSRWEIGQALAARWPELKPRIEAGSISEYLGAPRAPDTSLNCARAQKLLSFKLPGLTEWLAANPREAF